MTPSPTRLGRFAPSPTGLLHLGSARTALAAWADATSVGGGFVLRVEDLDAPRVIQGAVAALIADLRWLGITWSEGPDVGGVHGPYEQSARAARYDEALRELRDARRVFPCVCSRKDVESAAGAPHGAEAVYPGTCRDRDPDAVLADATARGRRVSWRFRVDAREWTFVDAVHGTVSQQLSREVGDFVVHRSDGVAAYQLAVVVDDIAMEITDVVRGDDLLASTPRQLLLREALGGAPVRHAHVPLVLGDDGARLAKRHGAISLRALRESGVAGERVRDVLWASLGQRAPFDAHTWDVSRVPRESVRWGDLRRELPEIG